MRQRRVRHSKVRQGAAGLGGVRQGSAAQKVRRDTARRDAKDPETQGRPHHGPNTGSPEARKPGRPDRTFLRKLRTNSLPGRNRGERRVPDDGCGNKFDIARSLHYLCRMIAYERTTLANGLTVAVNRDRASKLAAVNIL